MKIGPILVAALLLVTAVAGYYVFTTAHATPAAPPAPPVILHYSDYGNYTYVAKILPNLLYNTTNVSGNITLFTTLVTSINLTFVFTLVANASATIALTDRAAFEIATPSWTKVLNTSTRSASVVGHNRLVLVDHALINLTYTLRLKNAIDNQTTDHSQQWALKLRSDIQGGIATNGPGTILSTTPTFRFNVTGVDMTPIGFNNTGNGTLLGPAPPGGTGGPPNPDSGYAFLAGSIVALGVAVWYWRFREDRPSFEEELERLTGPYSEVIVRTRTRPRSYETIRLSRWEDLTKVADTTGKPILRLEETLRPLVGSFWVIDGDVGYHYEFAAPATRRSPPARTGTVRPPGTPAAPSPSAPRGKNSEPPNATAAAPSATTVGVLVDRLSARIAQTPALAEANSFALREIQVARNLSAQGRWVEAVSVLQRLEARLNRTGSPPTRPS